MAIKSAINACLSFGETKMLLLSLYFISILCKEAAGELYGLFVSLSSLILLTSILVLNKNPALMCKHYHIRYKLWLLTMYNKNC